MGDGVNVEIVVLVVLAAATLCFNVWMTAREFRSRRP
jgi:hypothetical protein